MPAANSYTAHPSNFNPPSDGKIPSFLSNYIGRSRDVSSLKELLQDDSSHLITLTGPGGIGKTRLAAKVATEQFDLFEDGVCWVDLGTLADPEHVQQKVVAALGLSNGGLGQPTDEMMDSPNFSGTFRGLGLDEDVLRKFYFANALNWFPEIFDLQTGKAVN